MNPSLLLRGVLLRTVLLAVVTAAYVAALSRSESTDALGAGLLAFLILVLVAFAWSLVDAVRRGFKSAALLWLLTSVAAGLAVPVVLSLGESADHGVIDALTSGAVFFAVLLFVPAVIGSGLGSLGHRLRGDRAEVASIG